MDLLADLFYWQHLPDERAMLTSIVWPLTGVLAHYFLWIRGEWDDYSGHIVLAAIICHTSLAFALQRYREISPLPAHRAALHLEFLHLFGTVASIVVYRIFFHRLCGFPGPLTAKIWIWDIVFRTWMSNDRQSVVIDGLHARYGPIVRYAPNRLSINDVAAVSKVHGTGSTSQCSKSVVYLNPVNGGSINADRQVASHHARRKVWERALSQRRLPSYVPPLCRVTSALVARLRSLEGTTTVLNHHVQMFTFDAMGLIGFGREGGFDALSSGVLNPAMTNLIDMMNIGVYMMLVPWLHVLLDYLPTLGIIYKPDEVFRKFARTTLVQYCDRKVGNEMPDTDELPANDGNLEPSASSQSFKDILNQIHPNPSLTDKRTLSDCVLLAIAGADTTSSLLVHTIYRLARHEDLQAQIYDEIISARAPVEGDGPEWQAEFGAWIYIAQLPHLEAFIKEVLRIHPPAPTGLPRLTPDEGFAFSDYNGKSIFIPGCANVAIPVYSIQRDSKHFERPLEFLPQRFLPASHPDAEPSLVHDIRAYMPFLQGPYGCAGKQLAYLEMKIVVTALISFFEISFPGSMSLEDIFAKMDAEWRDYSTVKPAQVEVQFISRRPSSKMTSAL